MLAALAALCLAAPSDPAHAQDQTAPGAPTSVSLSAGAGSFTVTWAAPTSNGGSAITSYDLRYIETAAQDKADANWTLVTSVWTSGALSYALAGLRDSTGYDVQLRAVNATGSGAWSTPATTGTTTDHGGTTSTATALSPGSSADGRLATGGDADVFSITVAAGTDLWVYATGELDTTARLLDSSNTEVAANDDGLLPPNPRNFSIHAELTAAGTYYVTVTAEDSTATGTYTLHAVTVATPGSTTTTAATLMPGSLAAARLASGATHYFKIELSGATDLWAYAIGETDISGELLTASQARLVQNDDSEFTGNESAFSLRASVAAGTYYVKVTGDAGPYVLAVAGVSGPGSTRETAAPLTLALPAPGRIDSAGNEDYFTITVGSASHVRLEAHRHGSTLRLTPTLFDAQGMELPLYYLNATGWDQVDDKSLGLWALERLAAGTYSIRIKAESGQTGSYVLHATVDAEMEQREAECRARAPTSTISDPLYGCQWHLNNTRQFDDDLGVGSPLVPTPGFDINVEAAWATTLGEGINVLVVDSGVDYLHPDLRGYEYTSDDPDDDSTGHRDPAGEVRQPLAIHGTYVAGVIAARDNDVGGRGVAPRATILSYTIARQGRSDALIHARANRAEAAGYMADVVAVSSNSWRLASRGFYDGATPEWDAAIEAGITSGFGGKGVAYMWLAQNGHPGSNANLDGMLSHYGVNVVGAVDYSDVRAGYSERGSNLLLSAPARDQAAELPGIPTTALGNDYNMHFTGTSAATPIVSGVVALMRAANPALTWRDVRLILAGSARRNDTSHTGWSEGAAKYGSTTSPPERYWFNHDYGFGVVDAGAAVTMATGWGSSLPPLRKDSATASPNLMPPDAPTSGEPTAVTSTLTLDGYVGFIEYIQVELVVTHQQWRQLRFELVSPSSTTSELHPSADEGAGARSKSLRFGSVRHLGESAAGTWTLHVTDEITGRTGSVGEWTLKVYGHGHTPSAPVLTSATIGAGALTVAWTAPEDAGSSAITSYDARRIRSDAMDKSDANWTTVTGIWTTGDLEGVVGGLDDGVEYDIQVRGVNSSGAGRWSGTSKGTTAVAPGAPAIRRVTPRDGELGVTWTAPASDGGVPVESYDARTILASSTAAEKAGDANWDEHAEIWTSTPGGDLRGTITGLTNGSLYDVQIRAENAVDPGSWSATVTGTPAVVNEDPEFPGSETGARTVREDIGVGQNVGAPVAAADPDTGDTLTYSIPGGHALFEIVETSGQLRTKAALDYETATSHAFTVQVSDLLDSSDDPDPTIDDTITVTVTVTDVDEPPEVTLMSRGGVGVTVAAGSITVEENYDGALASVQVTDPEGVHTDYTLALGGTHAGSFMLSAADGLRFASPPNYEARSRYSLTITASNAHESGALGVTVDVSDVDEPPVIGGPLTVNLNESVDPAPDLVVRVGTYTKLDPDRPARTTSWGPVGGSVALGGADSDDFEFDQTTGRLTFADPPDYEAGGGSYAVSLTANDGTHAGTAEITVNIANVDEPGTLRLGARRGVLNVPLQATLQDPDGLATQTWTWQRSTSRSSGWTDIPGSNVTTYTPVAADRNHYLRANVTYTDLTGSDEKTLAASTELTTDNERSSNVAPVAPDPLPQIADVPEDARAGTNVVRVVFSDQENDQLTYSLGASDEFAIHERTGQITVKQGANLDYEQQTSYSVVVTVDDGYGGVGTATLTIGIGDVNEPPEAANLAATVAEDGSVEINVLSAASDVDAGTTLSVAGIVRSPQQGTATVDTASNVITYTPRANYHGSDNFSYRIQDDGSPRLTATATVSISVSAVNDDPVFTPATGVTRSVSENAAPGDEVGAPVTATDVDSDDLVYSLSGSSDFVIDPGGGQIAVADQAILNHATTPEHVVTVTAADGDGGSANVDVTIEVTARPAGPPIIFTGGGGGGPTGPTPSEADFEWNVKRDIEALDSGHDNPTGSWSDGVTLWLAENGDGADDAVYAYDLATGERVEDREFPLDQRNRAPRGVASDGTTVWVSDSGQDRLFAYDLATGERLEARDIVLAERNRDVRGIWSDGTTMWVLNANPSLFAYDLTSGELLAQYALDSGNSDPRGTWSDGVTIWVSDPGSSPRRLFAYRVPTLPDTLPEEPPALERVREEEFEELSSASNNSPRGIWSDGDVMYVADASDGRVYTYNMPNAIDARLASLTLNGVEIGTFDPATTEYKGVPGEGVTQTTVEASAVQRRTTVAIDPPDADPETEGHQVSLTGVGEITVTVTSQDGTRTKVYRVTLERPPVEVALEPGWTTIEWPGADGAALADGLPESVTAVYAWDEAAGTWLAYFPGLEDVPGLNTLTAFDNGRTYWVAVGEPVTWTVPAGARN